MPYYKINLTVVFVLLEMVTLTYSRPRLVKLPITFQPENTTTEASVDADKSKPFPLFKPKIPSIDHPPKCADGHTFCEDIDTYPYIHLKYILEKNAIYKDLFTEDEIVLRSDVDARMNHEGQFVCASVPKVVYPKIGKTKNNKWKYIVNQDDFLQSVRIETCRNTNGPCDVIGEVREGYITSCKQKYVYSKLLSLSEKGAPTPDTFQLPSACCCSYKRNMQFLPRFGAKFTPAKIIRNNDIFMDDD